VTIVIDVDKDVYTLVVEDCDALDKHVNCEMKYTCSWTELEVERSALHL